MKRILMAAALLPAIAGCSGGGTENKANVVTNVAAEQGDLNAAISGDELSPIPEAEDDMAANMSGSPNAAAARNDALPELQRAPPPPAPD